MLPKLAYLSMLFILELAYTAGSAGQLLNKYLSQVSQLQQTDTREVKLASYDGACYAGCYGTTLAAVSQMMMEWEEILFHNGNI